MNNYEGYNTVSTATPSEYRIQSDVLNLYKLHISCTFLYTCTMYI